MLSVKQRTLLQRKQLLLAWAKETKTPIPAGFRLVPYMGSSARRLLASFQAWSSLYPTGRWNEETLAKLAVWQHKHVSPEPAIVRGVDLSNNNASFDFAAAKRGGIAFAFHKASDGTNFVDRYYASRRAAAHEAGMAFGAYHFAQPGQNPIAQARLFLSVASLKPGDLLPVLDLEVAGYGGQRRFVTDFAAEVRRALKCDLILYSGKYHVQTYVGGPLPGVKLWIASWGCKNPPLPWRWSSWCVWQTGLGRIIGSSRAVDLDVARTPLPVIPARGG